MEFLLDLTKKYSLPVALLLLAIWWLNSRLAHIEQRLENCEADKFAIITQNNERSNQVIQQNSIALERNTEVMQSIQAYLGMGATINQKKSLDPLTARQGIKSE